MSDLFTIIADHLAGLVTAAASVTAATSAVQAEDMVLGAVPIVLVAPTGERWEPPREAAFQVTVSGRIAFSCIVALTFPGGAAEWSAVRDQLRQSLLGWTPDWPEAAKPIEASGARLLAFSAEDGGRWLHAFDFNLPVQATYGIQ